MDNHTEGDGTVGVTLFRVSIVLETVPQTISSLLTLYSPPDFIVLLDF